MKLSQAGQPVRQVSAQSLVVAGVGTASSATTDEIIALVSACLSEADISPHCLRAIVSHARKAADPALAAVAGHFNVPLRLLDNIDLMAPAPASPFVLATVGVPNIAEAAALAAGPLVLAKRKSAYATCALASVAADFRLDALGRAAPQPNAKASIAASTLATSRAGP